jgi:hypothetical protein
MQEEKPASGPVDVLIVDLLEWVARGDRSYAEVMDAWRTSCPRLPVWEDANDRGLLVRERLNGRSLVRITSAGRAFLAQHARLQQTHASAAAPET